MRFLLWVGVAAVSVVLVGCGNTGEVTPSPSVIAPTMEASPTHSPDPSPSFTGEKQAIYEAVQVFIRADDAWKQQPSEDVTSVIAGTTGEATQQMFQQLRFWMKAGDRREGSPSYRSWHIGEPSSREGGISESEVKSCTDMKGTALITKDGTRQPNERTYYTTYVMRKDNGQWRVAKIQNAETPC